MIQEGYSPILEFTLPNGRRLDVAGEIIGIELADHIILGDGKYFSFKEESRR